MSRKPRSSPFSFGRRQGRDDDDELVLRLSLKDVRQRRIGSSESDSVGSGSRRSSKKKASMLHHQQHQDLEAIEEFDSGIIDVRDDESRGSRRSVGSKRYNRLAHGRRDSQGVHFEDDRSQSSRSVSTKSQAGEEAAIKNLITQDLWGDDPATVERGLKKLSGILGVKKESANAKRSRNIIFKAGGHLAIVQAMRKHKNSEGVQGEGCRALGIAAEEIVDSGNENAIAIVGGIDAILIAMRHFRNDEQIQDFGCGALQNLTGLQENARLLVEREGLTVVLMSMRSFPKSTLVQESACWTIVNLCLYRENRAKIEKARCMSTVASAIDNHPRCHPVKVAAQEALQHLLSVITKADYEDE